MEIQRKLFKEQLIIIRAIALSALFKTVSIMILPKISASVSDKIGARVWRFLFVQLLPYSALVAVCVYLAIRFLAHFSFSLLTQFNFPASLSSPFARFKRSCQQSMFLNSFHVYI